MQTKNIRICLRAYIALEHAEVLKVPVDLSPDQLAQLVNDRYQTIDGGQYVDDPEYWERGDCRYEPAAAGDRPAGEVTVVDEKLIVTEFDAAPNGALAASNTSSAPAHAPDEITDGDRLDFLEAALRDGDYLNFRKKHFSLRPLTNYEYDVFRSLRETIDDRIKDRRQADRAA